MKMCNYFLGDAYASGRNLGDDRCNEFMLAEFEDSTECEAAAHAIRNHDALVEALSDALEMAEGLDVHGLIYLEQQEKWERLVSILEKAKGES